MTTARFRLEAFFGKKDLDLPLVVLTPKRCEGYYEELSTRQSVDTHQNTLILVKAFFAWCQKQKYFSENPAAEIEPIGKRRRGKEQLREDEAKRFFRMALGLAREGKPGATAALCALLLGLRASEIVGLTVRDLDRDGTLLWVAKSKTQAGVRKLKLPEVLQPLLKELARDKLPTAPLFRRGRDGRHYRREWPREWVHRICELAGVPLVNAHGLRGMHASLATEAGETAWAVARALGHTNTAVGDAHYTRPEAKEEARQAKIVQLFGEQKS